MTTTTSTSTTRLDTMKAAIAAMNSGEHYFDVTIICTTDDHQADYWMDRLQSGLLQKKGDDTSSFSFPLVLAVSEDWENSSGAGNGLGTLYAWSKAVLLAKEKAGIDINEGLLNGSLSAALFHTAGKGTRLAPLPAGENNNKPGVVRAREWTVIFALEISMSECVRV